MDATNFDRLTRTLSYPSARRGLLASLAALPVPGGLLALLGDEAEAKSRKKRKKNHHDHGQGRSDADKAEVGTEKSNKKKRRRRKKCKKRRQKICAGQCGQITFKCNKRKQTVDCGSCACQPACPTCQRCNETSRTCEPDPGQQGKGCGQAGQVCQSNGTCRCDANSCGECGACGADGTCGELCDGVGCCNRATCQPGNENSACGTGGETCAICSGQDTCQGGECICVPLSTCPPPLNCGTISDGCGGTLNCGACGNPTPICVDNVCTACTADGQCPSGQWCNAGSCQACDVCPSGCTFFSPQAAIEAAAPGSTLRICPGIYPPISVSKNLTLIGQGRGDAPDRDTIFDAENNGTVVTIPAGVIATLADLRITGGASGGVFCEGDVTLNRCTVIDNARFIGAGGGGLLSAGTATLSECVVRDNHAFQAGGIHHEGTGTLTLDNTLVTQNHAEGGTGGGVVAGNPLAGNCAVHILNGSAITSNQAAGAGGGLYVTPNAATDLASSVAITGNKASQGGGIFAEGGATINVNSATVEGNVPNNCVGVIC